jgi:hypothetical protein
MTDYMMVGERVCCNESHCAVPKAEKKLRCYELGSYPVMFEKKERVMRSNEMKEGGIVKESVFYKKVERHFERTKTGKALGSLRV